ncbi:MAG TPA: hypothetical protein VGC05_11265 [Mycobacterium sp.]
MKASTMAAGLGASVLVIGVSAATTGCGSTKSASPSSTTSSAASTSTASSSAPTSSGSAAQPSDYSNLLIKPSDIVVPADTFALASSRPSDNPAGVTATFASASVDANGPTREIDVVIHVYPDAAGATQEHDQVAPNVANAQLGFTLVGGTATPADVGTGGAMALGTNSDASKQRARVVFSEGRAFVQIEFFNPGNDPLKSDFVLDVARKQDAAVKAGLPA